MLKMGKRFWGDLKRYWPYAVYSAKAILKSEVANSYLNWIWWILEPFCFMLIYVFIFGMVFHAGETYFPVFVYIGIALWGFFNKSVNQSVKLIKNSKSIITKVYVPKFVLILTVLLVNGFKMLISMGIIVLMILFYRIPVGLNIIGCIPVFMVFLLFTFGCCAVLLHFGVYIEDLTNVVHISLRLLMYMTGIFFDIEARLPVPYNRYVLHLNPVAFFISSMRKAILENVGPSFGWTVLYLFVSISLAAGGLAIIYSNENNYVKAV